MMKNHLLSKDFDISPTFREKIRAKKQKKDADLDLDVVNTIIIQKHKIDYIQCSNEGVNNLFLDGKRYSLNKDELIMVIREASHLYYDKKKQLFLNLKLIRTIEKRDNKITFSYDKGIGVEFLDTPFQELDDFFNLVESANIDFVKKEDFDFFNVKYFKIKSQKFIHKSLFVNENKYLEESNRFSIINILSVTLFYFIPFIPYVGINKFSLWIFPLTTLLISGLFFRRYDIKKQVLDMH